jgi:hypothetical protein
MHSNGWHQFMLVTRPKWHANQGENEGDFGRASADNGGIPEPCCHCEQFKLCFLTLFIRRQAIFLAGLQGQMISVSTSRSDNSLSLQLVNAFWFAGIFCDVFGAVLAMLSVRKKLFF